MRSRRMLVTIAAITALILSSIVFAFLAGCEILPYGEPVAGGQAVRYDFKSTVDGLNLPCSIYLPKGYNASNSYPVWVELHALEGVPIVSNNMWDIFSNSIKGVADANGWIVLSPWGRNLGSYYIDGVEKNEGPNAEPDIIDDLSSLDGWTKVGGNWTAASGVFRQSDGSSAWKEIVRSGSTGQDYAVRARLREVSRTGSVSSMGINLRRDPITGDSYHVDLYTEGTNKYVRLFRYSGGDWTLIQQMALDWQPLTMWDSWINLKVTSYNGYIRVFVNDKPVDMSVPGDAAPYGTGRLLPEPPVSGEVSLCSLGGVHEFDELRVDNEYEYGETDVIDCINQAMEKLNIDEDRVYVSVLSMGAVGSYVLGIHAPGLVAAVSPNAGASDLVHDYQFLKEHFPTCPGPPYADINDAYVCDYWRIIAGTEHEPDHPMDTPLLKDNSARYVLENMANMPIRIVQGLNDSNFPNSHENMTVMWWSKSDPTAWWLHVEAPAPYSPATSTFANGGDIYNLLTAWSSQGPYYAEYNTSPYGGHGFMEPYEVTAAFFAAQARERHPAQVAYKSYDDEVSESYWMKMKRYAAAGDEAALARVSVDLAANSVSAHARNVEKLTLDLQAPGISIGPGETVTVRLDTNTDPSAMPVVDKLKMTELELVHAWPAAGGLEVRLDGTLLQEGVGYFLEGASLRVPSIAMNQQRVLSVKMPAALPSNLLANGDFENVNPDGTVPGWNGVSLSGGTVRLEANRMQSHTGEYSLRVKEPKPASSPYICGWESDPVVSGIHGGNSYTFHASYRTRVFKGASVRASIYWYDVSGNPLGSSASPAETPSGYSTHGWVPIAFEAQAPAGAVSATVRLETVAGAAAQATGSVWFDDAVLYEIP
jgi:poly(3-hydroxybutyrate) depolymerase